MDLFSILTVAIICIVIGFLLGQLTSNLGTSEAESSLSHPNETALKIWQKPETQNIVVELDGHPYERGIDLSIKSRDQLNRMILDLNNWIESSPLHQSGSDTLANEAPLTKKVDEDTQPRVSINPFNLLADALRANVPVSQLPPESMIDQIDDILQTKLEAAGLKDKAVRLMEWPNIGMMVMIGLEKYESVEDIPDEEIRNLIRAAVKSWEHQQDIEAESKIP